MAQTVVTKKRPQDRQPKASAPSNDIIDIEDEEKPITVNLIGKQYTAHRPKSMLAIRLGQRINDTNLSDDLDALVESMREFVTLMFGTETAADIMARLEDPDDRLDLPHIQRLVNRMVEVTTGRPPTSSPESGTSS